MICWLATLRLAESTLRKRQRIEGLAQGGKGPEGNRRASDQRLATTYMIQFLIIGLVIVVAGVVAFLAFFVHYVFEALREHGQVRQVIDEKDLAEIREDIEGLSAKLLESSERAQGMVKQTEEKSAALEEQLRARMKEAEEMLARLESEPVSAETHRVEEAKIEELKSKVKEIEEDVVETETETGRNGETANQEETGVADEVAEAAPSDPIPGEAEVDLEKELLGGKGEARAAGEGGGEDSAEKFQPEKMDEVLKLASAGQNPLTIAKQVGLEVGEVELIINLRSKKGE